MQLYLRLLLAAESLQIMSPHPTLSWKRICSANIKLRQVFLEDCTTSEDQEREKRGGSEVEVTHKDMGRKVGEEVTVVQPKNSERYVSPAHI